MDSNYDETFDNRAHLYVKAQKKYPKVMENEFKIGLNHCNLKENDILLSIPDDTGLLKSYIPHYVEYLPFEFNKTFQKITGYKLAEYNNIPLENSSVHKILSIAGLHHFNIKAKEEFYGECNRILKTEGILVVGDVLLNSKQDKWLNDFVDKNNPYGHKGLFFKKEDKESFEKCGFIVSNIIIEKYTWNFDNIESMCDYCKNLFGLINLKHEEILNSIKKYLELTINKDDSCKFEWELIYFICKKH
jgi:SAM-dependent methyltransferase